VIALPFGVCIIKYNKSAQSLYCTIVAFKKAMIIEQIKKNLKNRDNSLLFLISFVSATNSLFFVYRAIKHVNFLVFFGISEIYSIYIGVALFYLAVLAYILRNSISFLGIFKKTLLIFLPSVVILSWGFYTHSASLGKIPYSNLLRFLSSFYIIVIGFYLLCVFKSYKNISNFFRDFKETNADTNAEDLKRKELFQKRHFFLSKVPFFGSVAGWFFTQGILATFVIITVIGLNLAFGAYHISEFAAVDEPLWTYNRIPKFWNNVADGEFHKTMVSDKPGITVALVSGIGLKWVANPMYYKNAGWEGETSENYLDVRDLNFALRFPIFLFNALMLLVFYILIKKLLGKSIALFSIILIGLSPILIGISSIINPDALLWVFVPFSILAYSIYLRDQSNKYLYIAGIFLGLSILTKYVANILYIFFFGMIFLEYIINGRCYESLSISKYLKEKIYDYFVLVFFSLAVFFFLLPAAWVDITRLFEGTILSQAFIKVWPLFIGVIIFIFIEMRFLKNKLTLVALKFLEKYKKPLLSLVYVIFSFLIIATLVDTYFGMKFYNLESISASPKSSGLTVDFVGLLLANFYSLIFGIIPVALVAILLLLVNNIKSNGKKDSHERSFYFYIIIFILLYYIASTASGVSANVRYQIIIYPLVFILAAIGIDEFFNIKIVKKYFLKPLSYAVLIAISGYSLNFIRPFYFSYASDLLPRQYVLNLKDMGDGSFEAAQYLNSLPDAKKLLVWTDKRGVCAFFIGSCQSGFDFDKNKTVFDYFVVSSGRETRTSKMTMNRVNGGNTTLFRLDKLYEVQNPEYKVEIGGRPNNFVKVISAKNIGF